MATPSKYDTDSFTISTESFDLSKIVKAEKDAKAAFDETFNSVIEQLENNDSSTQKITNSDLIPQAIYNSIQNAVNNKISEMTEVYKELKEELEEVCELMNSTFQYENAETSFELNMKNIANKFSQNNLILESCDMEQIFESLNLESVYAELESVAVSIPEEYETEEVTNVINMVIDKEEDILEASMSLKEDLKELDETDYPITEGNAYLDRQLRIENSELYAYCKNFLNTEFKVV